jgi:hypothetical protein
LVGKAVGYAVGAVVGARVGEAVAVWPSAASFLFANPTRATSRFRPDPMMSLVLAPGAQTIRLCACDRTSHFWQPVLSSQS